ncbi:MAG: hypothetical protein HYT37_00295 [Candidatus Sungbacteria bacterium]|nr:hypothetical protein [Candidatus Sungbacteria bacterium]
MTIDKLALVTQQEFNAVRSEMDSGLTAVRKEMDTGFAAVREEMDTGFRAVRKEMDTGFAAVREEMDTGFRAVRKEMAINFEDFEIKITEKMKNETITILQAFDKLATSFDAKEKEEAAHTALHGRISDTLLDHDARLKKVEAKK